MCANRLFTPTMHDMGGRPPHARADIPKYSAPDRRAGPRPCPPRSPTRARTATPATASCSSSPPCRSARGCRTECTGGARPGLERRVEVAAAVAGAIVDHHALDGNPEAGKEGEAAVHERRAGPLSSGSSSAQAKREKSSTATCRHDEPMPEYPLEESLPRPSALQPPPSDILATFLTSTWRSSAGRSRSQCTGVAGPLRRTSPIMRSTSDRRGSLECATILAPVCV